jgi:hypothetical protein
MHHRVRAATDAGLHLVDFFLDSRFAKMKRAKVPPLPVSKDVMRKSC